MILGPEGPPPPDLPMEQFGGITGQPEDPFGIHDEPLPAAELVPRRSPADPRGPATDPVEAPGGPAEAFAAPGAAPRPPDFLVAGNDGDSGSYIAVCGGREIMLNATERAAVRQVVLRAIARGIRAELDAVAAQLPKRRRRGKAPGVEQSVPSPVRRVRRKTALHP